MIAKSQSQPLDTSTSSSSTPIAAFQFLSSWPFLLIALVGCAMSSSTVIISFFLLIALPPEANCTQSKTIRTDRQWFDCTHQALYQGNLDPIVKGLAVVRNWTPTDPLYYEAQTSLEPWSRRILTAAQQKASADNVEEAIALARHIPDSSPIHEEVQTAIASWQGQQRNAQTIVAIAQDALKQQNWHQVDRYIKELKSIPQGIEELDAIHQLSTQLQAEETSAQALHNVFHIASYGTLYDLDWALTNAMEINQKTYAWQAVEPDLVMFASQLLDDGHVQIERQQWDEASAIAKKAAIFSSLAKEAQYLEDISQAHQLAIATDTNWMPSPKHLFQLREAIAAMQNIPKDSRWYDHAQRQQVHWQAQLTDLNHLQMAQASASLGLPSTIKWAAQQAAQLSSDRPRRVQAQTLAAHWAKEVERIHDRYPIEWASQLAHPGTPNSLNMAIVRVQKIESDRPLYEETQQLIHDWPQ